MLDLDVYHGTLTSAFVGPCIFRGLTLFRRCAEAIPRGHVERTWPPRLADCEGRAAG